MRVELSPWQYATTSLDRAKSSGSAVKRRRDRSETNSSGAAESCIIASFIEQTSSSTRSRKKRIRRGVSDKRESLWDDDDRIPVLTATTAHRISVLVEADSRHTEVSSTDLEGFLESTTLQFASRPGPATSFLPQEASHRNGTTKAAGAAYNPFPIPAVFDALRSRAFALQDNNTKLVGLSGDDVVSARLASPALSLSLVHTPRTRNTSSKCLVYGTCQDSRIYVACIVDSDKEQSFAIEYFCVPLEAVQANQGKHVGTFASIQPNNTPVRTESAGTKRSLESTEELESPVIAFYQLFRDGSSVFVTRLLAETTDPRGASTASNEENTWIKTVVDTSRQNGSSISVNLLPHHSPAHWVVARATGLGFVEGNSAVSMFYTVNSNETNASTVGTNISSYYTSISLVSGRMTATPICLPSSTLQVGLVGPALLAVLTCRDEILLFDTTRGAQIHSSLPFASSEATTRHFLVTDSKRSRLAIVFEQDGIQKVAFASARAESSTSMQPLLRGPKLSLAAGLASSLQAPPPSSVRRTYELSTCFESVLEDKCNEHKAVARGLQMLEEVARKLHSAETKPLEPNFLLEGYRAALTTAQGFDSVPGEKNGDNPQDAVLSTNGKRVNGFHKEKHSRTETVCKARDVPQAFLGCAVSIAISLLCSVGAIDNNNRSDAREILRQLVQSGKLSARKHLMSVAPKGRTYGFMELLTAWEAPPNDAVETCSYTPFHLMNDMFSFCLDISEHQMVSMLHHTMSRSLPKDIASYFAREGKDGHEHPRVVRSTRLLELESTVNLSTKEEQERSKLRSKLVVSGLLHLIQCIVKYSKFNSSLLRDALRSELARNEVIFLTRCLVKKVSGPCRLEANAESVNGIKWLTVLYDTFRDVYTLKDQKRLKRAVTKELSKTNRVLSLKTSVQEAVALIDTRKISGSETASSTNKSDRASLPSYQIERLVF